MLNRFRLKGGRKAREDIWAGGIGAAFAERKRSYVWYLRLDRTCSSTAGLCAPSYSARVLNPSSPYTLPQPRYQPITPTTPSTTPYPSSTVPSSEVTRLTTEEFPSTTPRSQREASVAKTRSVHHHQGHSAPVSYRCGWFHCVPTYACGFPF